jgi:hypothetical protein
MGYKYILVDEEFERRILQKLEELKKAIDSVPSKPLYNRDEPMDTADAMAYLKVCRRTLQTYREKGLPYKQKDNGKIYYWKTEIDEFLSNNNA